jgi:hypothetical protein
MAVRGRRLVSEKARRRALKFAVKTRLIPHINAMGFESMKACSSRTQWVGLNPSDYDLGRRRGDRFDFLSIYWEKYARPEFLIFFATSDLDHLADRSPPGWVSGTLNSGHYALPWGLLAFGGTWFGPHQPADAAVGLAIQRLEELDAFLKQPNPRASARIVRFGFNDYAPTLAGKWLRFALGVFPRWLGRTWRAIFGRAGKPRA